MTPIPEEESEDRKYSITIRLTSKQKSRLRELSEQNHRTMSQQVLFLIDMGILIDNCERKGIPITGVKHG